MRAILTIGIVVLVTLAALLAAGCSKEKTVESTQYVHDIKYVEVPADTIIKYDTIIRMDTVKIDGKDTVIVIDTVRINTVTHDTVRVTSVVHDTVKVTSVVHDTVFTIKTVHDTIVKTQYAANIMHAITAMEVKADTLVLQYVYSQLGENNGWIFYLSPEQMSLSQVSTGVYDIGVYIDYYAADFSGDYPLEASWRLTYKSGDPQNPNNWTMADPPTGVSGFPAGLRLSAKATPGQLTLHAAKN
jgi:hypothetical protein